MFKYISIFLTVGHLETCYKISYTTRTELSTVLLQVFVISEYFITTLSSCQPRKNSDGCFTQPSYPRDAAQEAPWRRRQREKAAWRYFTQQPCNGEKKQNLLQQLSPSACSALWTHFYHAVLKDRGQREEKQYQGRD